MTASTSSTLRPTTAGTLVAGFPRGRFSASPGTRVLSFSRASSTISPADALRGPGPLGAREGAGDVAAGCIERSARPLPVAGAGLDQAAQRLVCGAAPRAVLDGHLIARQADRAVDVADGTGPASSRTPYPTAEQAGPQVLRAPVAAALSSPPPDPLPGLAAALRGLTHEAARFPQLIIIYDQIPDRRRGRGFATGIHLNEALEWSKRPGPPQSGLVRKDARLGRTSTQALPKRRRPLRHPLRRRPVGGNVRIVRAARRRRPFDVFRVPIPQGRQTAGMTTRRARPKRLICIVPAHSDPGRRSVPVAIAQCRRVSPSRFRGRTSAVRATGPGLRSTAYRRRHQLVLASGRRRPAASRTKSVWDGACSISSATG